MRRHLVLGPTLALTLHTACGDSAAGDEVGTTSGENTTTGPGTSTGSSADDTSSTGTTGGPTTTTDPATTDSTTSDPTTAESSSTGDPAVCGDGVVQSPEECDGDDLGDAGSCASVDPELMGPLGCTPRCAYDMSACAPAAGMGVALNEVTSSPDDDIELHHAGTAAVDLSGWILTDDLAEPGSPYDPDLDPEKYVFPDGTTLDPGAFVVVIQGAGGIGHPFGLSSSGDAVALLMPDLTVVDHVVYEDGEAVASYCRLPDGPGGTWTADCTPTFDEPNMP